MEIEPATHTNISALRAFSHTHDNHELTTLTHAYSFTIYTVHTYRV